MEQARWQMILEVRERARRALAGIYDLEVDVIEANGRPIQEFIHVLENGRAFCHLNITGRDAAQIETLLQLLY